MLAKSAMAAAALTSAVLCVAAGAPPADPAPVEIVRVFPEKICFRPRSTARFQVAVRNSGEGEGTVRLVCAVEGGLDEKERIYDRSVTVPAGGKKVVTASWRTGDAEWGFDIVASLFGKDGELLAAASDSFAVTDQNWRVGGGVGQWTVVYDPLPPEELARRLEAEVPEQYRRLPCFLLTGPETVQRVRRTYATHLEWYSWEPSGFNSRSPQAQQWVSGQGQYYMSKRKIVEVNRALQEQGIQVWTHQHTPFTGIDGLEFIRAHPEWIAYDEWGGGITADVEELTMWREGRPVRTSGGPLWGTAVLMVPEAVDFHADQIIASTRMFGWDGLRSDGPPMVLPCYRWEAGRIAIGPVGYRYGFKYDGALVNARDAEEADRRSLALWQRFVRRIRAEFPDFQFAVNPLGYPEPGFLEETFSRKGWCRDGYILDEGVKSIEVPGHYYNNWRNFKARVQDLAGYVRGHGSLTQVVLFMPDGPAIVPGRRHASAIVRASQCHPLYLIGPPSHARFALRYSALIAAGDVEKVREGARDFIRVSASRGIWWSDFVYSRHTGPGQEQLIIHLLNEPNRPAYGKEDGPPPVQENVAVSLKTPPDRRLEKAFYLNADTLERRRLEPNVEGRWTKVLVPRLEYWDVVVFELRHAE